MSENHEEMFLAKRCSLREVGLMRIGRTYCLFETAVVLMSSVTVFGAPIGSNVIADSVAEFSNTQGMSNWYYGYYDGESAFPYSPQDFKELPAFEGERWVIQEGPGGYWTSISAETAHPSGLITSGGRQSVEHWAVRRWSSNVDGRYFVRGVLADNNPFPGLGGVDGGVIGRIFLDSVEVFVHTLDEGEGIEFVIPMKLNLGSVVDFVVDPKNSIDWADSTTFTVRVVIPEPTRVILALTGLACCAVRTPSRFRTGLRRV